MGKTLKPAFIKLESINPQKENLTSEKLKSFSGLSNLSDKEANETVFALQTFASLLYDLVCEHKTEIRNLNEPINNIQLKTAA